MKEYYYDKLLNIKTRGEQQGFYKSLHYHRYEPTPYSALEELFKNYELKSRDHVVDFGCGRGRLNFYIDCFFHASVVGIEMDETLFEAAVVNRTNYWRKTKHRREGIVFHCCLAEEYPIAPSDNRFYFFNPFSVQVFRKVVNRILMSLEEFPRDVDLILYYPSEEYVYFLEQDTAFELLQEVRVPFVYEHNQNERFLIYRLE
ncbi:class I SAM-dependent methyltransferase [Neobacillus niacini]|uniref:class I SAM-dependent methyltransferase n=1 Tax=Neobacillus niacini TaxID=86668 RepID=UPI0021CB460C|nr:class I SAM-dependent methyltransferase [Neobacillus niacini]MCM3766788.1 class I SAM-dependent methyltransferase [Neobacillus niacini]